MRGNIFDYHFEYVKIFLEETVHREDIDLVIVRVMGPVITTYLVLECIL